MRLWTIDDLEDADKGQRSTRRPGNTNREELFVVQFRTVCLGIYAPNVGPQKGETLGLQPVKRLWAPRFHHFSPVSNVTWTCLKKKA